METTLPKSILSEALGYLKHIRILRQEHILCLSIGSNGHVIACHTVFIGTLTSAIIHPREIFAAAIADHAMEVIVAHNHPSGMAKPSDEDVATTQQLAAAGQILGIPLRDHIIVAKHEDFSFLRNGFL